MALSSQQIAGLDALNKKIASGYKATATDQANLAYAAKQGYVYKPATVTPVVASAIPTGATKIANPSQLTGLTESQIYRSGTDIYKLPTTTTVQKVSTPVSTPSYTGTAQQNAELQQAYERQLAGKATTTDNTNIAYAMNKGWKPTTAVSKSNIGHPIVTGKQIGRAHV